MPVCSMLFFLCSALVGLTVNDADVLFQAGLAAYDGKRFDAAAAAFADLKASGLPSGWLDYDLGSSELRAGRLGEAIAAYRRALVQLPRHSDIRANLDFARRSVQDAITPPEPPALIRGMFFWHYILNKREALWATSLMAGLFWCFRLPPLFGRQRRLFHGLSALAGFGALALGTSLALHIFLPSQVGVVLPDEVDVRPVNELQAPVRFRLHAGTEARINRQLDDWLLLELSDGKQGWVPEDAIAVITY